MEVEEPMDVDATEEFDKFDDLLEEGECEDEPNRISRKVVSSVISVASIKHEPGTFVTGVDIFSREAKEKIEERAKRFGLTQEGEKSILLEAENLYKSFAIDVNSESGKNYRLNVIHMRGTENLNTKDIFKYFEEYAPASIEWINDISCNVVWLDQASAARAMLGKSRKIIGIKKEPKERLNSDESDDSRDDVIINGKNHREENTVHIKDVRCPLPSGIWRKGLDFMDSRNIILRFATNLDKKQPHAEKHGMHHAKHDSTNYGGLKGILSTSRKRAYKEMRETSPVAKKEPDTDTNGIAAKNPWGSLSKNWGRTDFVEDDYLPKVPVDPVSNVKQRLGSKPLAKDDIPQKNTGNIIELSDSESESSSEEENWCKRSKMPRMRMHADDEEANLQKRKGKIRNLVNSTGGIVPSSDLRGKLVARRRLPPISKPPIPREPIYQEQIQVIVTNPKALRSNNFRDVNLTEDEDEDDDFEEQTEDDEEEEGEIVDDSGSDSKVEYEDEDDEEDEKEVNSESESVSGSSISEKEVQGVKGSVIKVVQHKPKLQSTVSTVWSRLNHSKNDRKDDSSPERYHSKRDLRETLRKTDLRSRIGNHHTRGRSPLRIELRNDKYSGRRSDSE